MSGCIECPSSDHCNTCGKHDPADSEMTRVKEFWTIIDKVLKHVPQTLATEARLIAAIGLQAAVRIGHRQAADWLQAERGRAEALAWPDFEAIRNLLEDQTGDNAACMVRSVVEAAQKRTRPPAGRCCWWIRAEAPRLPKPSNAPVVGPRQGISFSNSSRSAGFCSRALSMATRSNSRWEGLAWSPNHLL